MNGGWWKGLSLGSQRQGASAARGRRGRLGQAGHPGRPAHWGRPNGPHPCALPCRRACSPRRKHVGSRQVPVLHENQSLALPCRRASFPAAVALALAPPHPPTPHPPPTHTTHTPPHPPTHPPSTPPPPPPHTHAPTSAEEPAAATRTVAPTASAFTPSATTCTQRRGGGGLRSAVWARQSPRETSGQRGQGGGATSGQRRSTGGRRGHTTPRRALCRCWPPRRRAVLVPSPTPSSPGPAPTHLLLAFLQEHRAVLQLLRVCFRLHGGREKERKPKLR